MPDIRQLFPRDLRFYLVSRFCGATALTLLRSTVSWHVYQLSHSPLQLGLIGLVQFAPALTLSLVGGAVADTFERRRVSMTAQVVPFTAATLLALSTAHGNISVPVLYIAVFFVACAAAFDNPARASLLPTLVSRDLFPRAVTIASTIQALAFASGPAIGGLIIARFGIAAAYATHVALIAASMTNMSRLKPSRADTPRRAINMTVIREGLSFVRRQEVVLGCMTLDMFAVIFGGATALLPIYANDILHVGAQGFGQLSAALETGALISAVAMLFLPTFRRSGRALLVAVGAFGIATIVFGLSRWFPLSIAAYMAAGMADQVSVVMRSTMIQLSTPDELRGRVSSVNFIFIGASNQLGAMESGFVAAATNATFSVVSGGLGCLIVLAIVASRMPALRHYRIQSRAA
ncbi:MAG TPA: MFS transporter [Candidatus Acidoferrales bacterium]|nr:MFS transporter [Candidatus Acidoferrales bacterium]